MKIFYRKKDGRLQYRFGNDNSESWSNEKILTEEEIKSFQLKPLVDIVDGNLIFNSEYIEKVKFDQEKERIISIINEEANEVRVKMTKGASPEVLAGWNLKSSVASKVIQKTATKEEINAMKLEASLRDKGESAITLSKKILIKSNRLLIAVTTVDGFFRKALSDVKKSRNAEELKEISIMLKKKGDKLKEGLFKTI